jgi:hypothetical protein
VTWPKILAFYVLALALAFHLRGVWQERNPSAETSAPKLASFVEAVPERIDKVRMEAEGIAVQFERLDGRWVIVEPPGISSPGDVVEAVLDSLTSLPPIEVVAATLEHEGQFGLSPPRVRLRLEQQGEIAATIVLGELNPTRTAVYARRSGKDEIVLLGLNAKYYIDLVFENVRRQQASGGVVLPESGAGPAAARPN